MPENCPIDSSVFLRVDACESCPQYESDRDLCGWFFPRRPLTDILTAWEQVQRTAQPGANSKTAKRQLPRERIQRPGVVRKPAEGVVL